MHRKVGGQRIEDIKKQYPGYYQKKGNWKEKQIAKRINSRDLAIKKNVYQIAPRNANMGLKCRQFVDYSNAINSMDENINKLFKLL